MLLEVPTAKQQAASTSRSRRARRSRGKKRICKDVPVPQRAGKTIKRKVDRYSRIRKNAQVIASKMRHVSEVDNTK
eukprot:6201323-Amphidinium_carterae.1